MTTPSITDRREQIAQRLQRFVDGETVRTIYKLPPNGRHDPLRQDVAALLALLPAPLPLEGEDLGVSRDLSPSDDGGDQCRPTASLATAGGRFCERCGEAFDIEDMCNEEVCLWCAEEGAEDGE